MAVIAAQQTSTKIPVHHSGTCVGAGKSSWGRTSNPQEGYPGLLERDRGTQSSTIILTLNLQPFD